MRDAPALVGRQETLDRCLAAVGRGEGVLVTGPTGIGKSALLDALGAAAAENGDLVLRSYSTPSGAWLPYLGLYDLFADVVTNIPDMVPPYLRTVLDAALLRSDPGSGAPVDQLAVRVAVLELLRSLSRDRAVLLVLDDVHCLDATSADVLAFASRRLQEDRRVRIVTAERVDVGREPIHLRLLPSTATEVVLGALSGPDIAELLRTRLDLQPMDSVVERIRDASGGNPFYALELGRAVLRSGGSIHSHEPLLVPERLRSLLVERLSSLPAEAIEALLLIAAAARPRRGLLADHEQGLAEALDAGVVVCGPDLEVRFSHPLLGEVVYADATVEQRQACHASLAQLLDDPLERARHRALATTRSTAELADELADAARVAVHRGAPATAAELFRLAAERTPDDSDAVADRLLASAKHALDAGLPEQARAACDAILAGTNTAARGGAQLLSEPAVHHHAEAAARVGARLVLIELADGDPSLQAALLDAAESEALDLPDARARICLYRADHALQTGAVDLALAEFAQAEKHALVAGDVDLQIEVISLRASAEMQHRPDGKVALSLEQAAALAEGRVLTTSSVLVRRTRVVWLLRRGDVPEAIEEVNSLRADVERAGRLRDLSEVLHQVASVHERAGMCVQAHDAAMLGGRLRAETSATPGAGLVLSAAAELAGGTAERAAELANAAITAGELAGDVEWTAYAHGFRGRADLLMNRPAPAALHLEKSRSLLHSVGLTDPATFLVDADLAEALIRCGSFEAASRVIVEAGEEVDRWERDVLRLGLTRARLLMEGLTGDPRGAADRLRRALSTEGLPTEHPYPLEIARALLVLADLERRARRRAAARTALQSAIQAFAAAHCLPWHRHAQEILARMDSQKGDLTEIEKHIVELVRGGATNRQIAAALHLSVKAVEANLTRLFRRLGVSNRTELAAPPSAPATAPTASPQSTGDSGGEGSDRRVR